MIHVSPDGEHLHEVVLAVTNDAPRTVVEIRDRARAKSNSWPNASTSAVMACLAYLVEEKKQVEITEIVGTKYYTRRP